ncbi:MAG: HAD family hydrolase [Solirubrobacterales bacterium]
MKYKWCVCDMDGTLLNSKGLISDENENALKGLSNKGVEIIIATGRTDLMIQKYIKQLDLNGHIICCNGGLIRNLSTNEIIYSKTIENENVFQILKYCFNKNVDFLFYTEDAIYSNENNPRIKILKENNSSIKIELICDDILKNINEYKVLKILIVNDNHEEIKEIEKYFSKKYNVEVVSSYKGLLDIMATNITKGNALKFLSEKLHVELEHVIAFGDGFNDYDMLQNVGMPIAVSNAADLLKNTAKYVTTSNEESGVAFAINNYILKFLEID